MTPDLSPLPVAAQGTLSTTPALKGPALTKAPGKLPTLALLCAPKFSQVPVPLRPCEWPRPLPTHHGCIKKQETSSDWCWATWCLGSLLAHTCSHVMPGDNAHM